MVVVLIVASWCLLRGFLDNLGRHLEFCLAWLRGANAAIFDYGVGQMLGQFLKQCQRQKLLLLHWHMQEQLGAC